jgi:hypothetical protein
MPRASVASGAGVTAEKAALLFLPGNHPATKEWAASICTRLAGVFERTEVMGYLHWSAGRPNVDFRCEVERLVTLCEQTSEPYVIAAKSAGVALLAEGYARLAAKPVGAVLLGTPTAPGDPEGAELIKRVESMNGSLLFIQETNDPICSYGDLVSQLSPDLERRVSLSEIPGDDHSYRDVALVSGLIAEWAQQVPLPVRQHHD